MTHSRNNIGRRGEDKCLIRRWYAAATPYIQVLGFFMVAIPSGISATQLIGDARAFDGRLTSIELAQRDYAGQQSVIIARLDTVIRLMRGK